MRVGVKLAEFTAVSKQWAGAGGLSNRYMIFCFVFDKTGVDPQVSRLRPLYHVLCM